MFKIKTSDLWSLSLASRKHLSYIVHLILGGRFPLNQAPFFLHVVLLFTRYPLESIDMARLDQAKTNVTETWSIHMFRSPQPVVK